MWEVEFFEKENGRCPVEEFLAELSPKKDLPYIYNSLKQLEEHGNLLRRPHVDYLKDDIWELRVKTINGNFRFFYFFFDKDKIIITHGIKKKTAAVNPKEIDRAKEYKAGYVERKGRGR
jgi:phage-related protein